jgi:hypothetical protein
VAGGSKPDYRLAALHKGTEDTANVGVAWIKDNGRISIKLNAFVHLIGNKDLVLTLFPETDGRKQYRQSLEDSEHLPDRDDTRTPF